MKMVQLPSIHRPIKRQTISRWRWRIANIDFTVGSSTGTSIIFDSSSVIFLDVDGNSIAVTGLENVYIC